MIDDEVKNLYDQVYHDLYCGNTYERSFDENIHVWLKFKLHIESMLSGIDLRTFEFLQQYIDKSEREITEFKNCKIMYINDPKSKKIWNTHFRKSN